MRVFFLIVFFSLVLAGSALASEIRQLPYKYSFEFAQSLTMPAFVLGDFPPGKAPALAPRTVAPEIVIRVVVPVKAAQNNLASAAVKEAQTPEALALTIYFDFDSYVLRPAEKERLKDAFSQLGQLKGPVSVTGYTDDIGTRAYNMELSTARADAVAEYLKRLGVVPAIVMGKGECCPLSKIKKLNRRVEIKEVVERCN